MDVCEKWEVDAVNNSVNCSLRKSEYPKFECKNPFMVNNIKYCEERVLFQPRFFCTEMAELDGHRVCKTQTTYFGENKYEFRCAETGKIISAFVEGEGGVHVRAEGETDE